MFKKAYKVLKPGGWIETHEPASHIISQDGTVTPESALGQWGKIFDEGGKKLGQTFNVVDLQLQRKGLEEAGFVDIQEVDMVVCSHLPLFSNPANLTVNVCLSPRSAAGLRTRHSRNRGRSSRWPFWLILRAMCCLLARRLGGQDQRSTSLLHS